MRTEHFRCVPYSATMSRSSCGKRYREATCGSRPGIIRPVALSCTSCLVGKAHAAGRTPTAWPGGQPVALVQISGLGRPDLMPAERSSQPRIPAADRTPAGGRRPAKLVRGPGGELRTVAAWAELLGVSTKVIHTRLGLGWDEARAVSAPHQARRSS